MTIKTHTRYRNCILTHYANDNQYRVIVDYSGDPLALQVLSKIIDPFLRFPNLNYVKAYVDAAWDWVMYPTANLGDHHLISFYKSSPGKQRCRLDGPLPQDILDYSNDPELARLTAFASQDRQPFCKALIAEFPQFDIGAGDEHKVQGRPSLRFCGHLVDGGHSRCHAHRY